MSSRDIPIRSSSEPTVSGLLNISKLSHCATTGNLLSGDHKATKSIPKSKVKFRTQVSVVLIPSRTEYSTADLAQFLWWDETDYVLFKTSAIHELKELMRFKAEKMTTKEAIAILYQPSFDDHEIPDEESIIDSPTIAAPVECKDLGLIDAQTDVDLTSLRRHNKLEDELLMMVHPLALMCPQ